MTGDLKRLVRTRSNSNGPVPCDPNPSPCDADDPCDTEPTACDAPEEPDRPAIDYQSPAFCQELSRRFYGQGVFIYVQAKSGISDYDGWTYTCMRTVYIEGFDGSIARPGTFQFSVDWKTDHLGLALRRR